MYLPLPWTISCDQRVEIFKKKPDARGMLACGKGDLFACISLKTQKCSLWTCWGELLTEKDKLGVCLALEHPILGYLMLILCTY